MPSSPPVGKLVAVRREIVRKVRQVGVVETVVHIMKKMGAQVGQLRSCNRHPADPLDAEFGIDTSGLIRAGALDIPDNRLEHVFAYQPVSSELLLQPLEILPLEYERWVFVDIGSGKGRALLLASRFPFKQIIGVELSATLCDTARQNISRYRDPLQKCKQIEVICQDAVDYRLPNDNVVLFFYNPFGETIMQLFASNISQAIEESGKQLYLIYVNPLFRAIWERLGLLEPLQVTESYAIYRTYSRVCE
jgi:SAM-dependent methyltransferase